MGSTEYVKNNMMMKSDKKKITLDRPAVYQIRVPGHLESSWLDLGQEMTLTIGSNQYGQPISTMTGRFDQAALLGMLRRLYALGLPLISVECLEV
jgi:hypothetical protein